MTDNNNIPGLDQSWSEAEKMLDRHFRKKRMILVFFSLIVPAFIAGLVLMINHSKKVQERNVIATSQTELQNSHSTSVVDAEKISVIENTNINNKHVAHNKITSSNQIISDNSVTNNINKTPANNKGVNDQTEKSTNQSFSNTPTAQYAGSNLQNVPAPISSVEGNAVQSKSESISLLSPYFASLEVSPSESSLMEKSGPPIVVPRCSHKIGWELTVYGGAQYVNKTLSTTNDWNNYIMHRENEEDPIVTPFIGASVSANANSINVSLGFEYSVYGEKTNYYPYSNQFTVIDNTNWQTFLRSIVDTDTAYVTGNQYFLQTTYFRLDSSMITDHDTIEEYKYDEQIAKTNGINRIYYLEMPIEVSYCLSRGKFGFGLSGGLSPALRVQETGYYLRPDGRGVEALNEIKSFRKFMLNARMSVDLYYRVADRMKLVLRPQFRTNLNSVFEDDYGVNQKYYSTGVLFGVSYMLN